MLQIVSPDALCSNGELRAPVMDDGVIHNGTNYSYLITSTGRDWIYNIDLLEELVREVAKGIK